MQTSTRATAEAVLAALQANGFMIVDDHRRDDSLTSKVEAVSFFTRGEQTHLVPHFLSLGHCINPLYIDKETGKVHLSTGSVGGNVRPDQAPSLEAAILNFNEQSANAKFGSWGRIDDLLIVA